MRNSQTFSELLDTLKVAHDKEVRGLELELVHLRMEVKQCLAKQRALAQSPKSSPSDETPKSPRSPKKAPEIEPTEPASPRFSQQLISSPVTEPKQGQMAEEIGASESFVKVQRVLQALQDVEGRVGFHAGWLSESEEVPEWRSRLRELVGMPAFDATCGVLICTNAVFLGVCCNYAAERGIDLSSLPVLYSTVDKIFACIFLAEVTLRIAAAGVCDFFRSNVWAWNYFDCAIVSLDLAGLIAAAALGREGARDLTVFRMLRIFRMARTVRIVRLLRFCRELRMMVLSILNCGTSLVWSLVLLSLTIYTFTIYFVQSVSEQLGMEEHSQLKEHFGSVARAWYTLYLSMTGGVNWSEISSLLIEVEWFNAVVMCFYIFFTTVVLTNIIIGIFVDSAVQSAQSDRDEATQEQLLAQDADLERLRIIFLEADTDGNGDLTLEEFESHLRDRSFQAYLASCGIHCDDARAVFNLVDCDKSGSITVEEFVWGCMRIRGAAKSIDLAALIRDQKFSMQKQEKRLDTMERRLVAIQDGLQPTVEATV